MTRSGPAFETSVADVVDWRDLALCQSYDPEDWFSLGSSPASQAVTLRAKQICWKCPVMKDCDDFAEEKRVVDGVWAGLSETERAQRRRRRTRERQKGLN